MELESKILALLGSSDYLPLNLADLARELRLPPARKRELEQLLHTLDHAGTVVRIKGDRFALPRDVDLIPGRIRMTRSGRGFLQPDDPTLKEISVAENATGTALHEDRVLVRRDIRPRRAHRAGGDSDSGTVVRVLERHRSQLVGTLQRGRDSLYVVPDDPRIPHDVYVPAPRDVGRPANIGDKVVVELLAWESRAMRPEGEIIEVLGAPDAEGVDMLSILRQYNLPLHFPKSVLEEARSIGTVVLPEDLHGRTDCRHHNVITIDPDDAKDFDDAIYLEPSGSNWRLWVHIADVSHYVKPATALDAEARKRGNSTYLVDRVIPMLPEALSNELCSLKPGVDRLTKAVEFLLAHDGRVLESRFHSAVIHSKKRFTYGEAFAVLQRKPSGDIERMLHQANALAQKIRRARFRAGALALDFPEMKIRLDERGRVARIEKVENDISHQLIEEYMLLANEAVAGRLMSLRRPTVYRVHEEPDQARLDEYREEVLSHNVPCGNLNKRTEIQRLLQLLDTLPIGAALKIGFLKSLMRARYAVEPLGHYGLAKRKYAHFTSPIRRYADLVVHRSLFDRSPSSFHALAQVAEHISMTERNSADAERDSKDVKLYAFLRAQLESGQPQSYPALVTELRNFGFFVDVPGLAMSGLVPLSTIEDDFYIFDPQNNQLIGRRTRRIIRLGDKVTVQVFEVNSAKKQVDFRLVTDRSAARPQPRHDRPPFRQAQRQLRHPRSQQPAPRNDPAPRRQFRPPTFRDAQSREPRAILPNRPGRGAKQIGKRFEEQSPSFDDNRERALERPHGRKTNAPQNENRSRIDRRPFARKESHSAPQPLPRKRFHKPLRHPHGPLRSTSNNYNEQTVSKQGPGKRREQRSRPPQPARTFSTPARQPLRASTSRPPWPGRGSSNSAKRSSRPPNRKQMDR